MSKFVYFSLPMHGHVNPTLVLMQELARRGHQVTYYSGADFEEKIVLAGVPYSAYNPNGFHYDKMVAARIGQFAHTLVEFAKAEIPYVLPALEKERPDFIIHDSYAIWGKLIAYKLRVPAASIFTTMMFPMPLMFKYFRAAIPMFADVLKDGRTSAGAIARYKKLAREHRMKPDRFDEFIFGKEDLNIVLTSSYFQPRAKHFDRSFNFAGPLLSPSSNEPTFLRTLDPHKKLIYIAMGTVFGENPAVSQAFIRAFADAPYQVIISLGGSLEVEAIGKTPKNVIVKKYVPQLSILQKADLFISHAGMNSVSESLYYGVPMILFPTFFEQKVNAHRIEELGAGIYFRGAHFTKERLLQTVERVLSNKSFSDNAHKIQKTLHAAGGYVKAADLIEAYKSSAKPRT